MAASTFAVTFVYTNGPSSAAGLPWPGVKVYTGQSTEAVEADAYAAVLTAFRATQTGQYTLRATTTVATTDSALTDTAQGADTAYGVSL
jgi:hypothetical protein